MATFSSQKLQHNKRFRPLVSIKRVSDEIYVEEKSVQRSKKEAVLERRPEHQLRFPESSERFPVSSERFRPHESPIVQGNKIYLRCVLALWVLYFYLE